MSQNVGGLCVVRSAQELVAAVRLRKAVHCDGLLQVDAAAIDAYEVQRISYKLNSRAAKGCT